MDEKLTPMQEFIKAITENGLISINQTLIDGALKDEQKEYEIAFNDGLKCNVSGVTGQDYYNNKFKQNE